MIRREWDEGARRVRTWDDAGTLVEDRAFTAQENAGADAAVTTATREARWETLLGRAETAQQNNRDSLATLEQIAGRASFTNAQRDDALRFLAGRVDALTRQNNALMQITLRLAGRVAAMDAPD